MAEQIAGTAFVKADGQQFNMSGAWKVTIDTRMREMLVGENGPAGFKEMQVAPKFEGPVYLTPGTSMEEIGNITNATVTLELANGRSFLLRNAVVTGVRELDVAEGTFDIVFEGLDGEELA